MINALLVVIAFAAVGAYEIPKMLRDKLNREFVVFLVILGLGFAVAFMHALGVDVPNPFEALNTLVNWVRRDVWRLR